MVGYFVSMVLILSGTYFMRDDIVPLKWFIMDSHNLVISITMPLIVLVSIRSAKNGGKWKIMMTAIIAVVICTLLS